MKGEVILKVENVSKQYRLGTLGTGTLSHDLNRFWAKIRGKEDPYLKIGETNNRATKSTSEYVWALKDINFEVKRGEILGIIGKNGAGKSTLLKILSKVTAPSTGIIKSKGRIASLLEVGTGFHPEMTGKENIYLNGAILGMTKKEITEKFDEIVEFSGCERYIDTPVKRYSSGMKVRLAFAVAAFLEPDILVVDEVLAVGDAEFQKKAIGKMQDISNTDGRTVLFVSHNMSAVQSLCTSGILIEDGSIFFSGPISEVINTYLKNRNQLASVSWSGSNCPKANFIELREAKVLNIKHEISLNHLISEQIELEFTHLITKENELFVSSVNVFNDHGIHIFSSHDVFAPTLKTPLDLGEYKRSVIIPGNLLTDGSYSCSYAIMRYNPFTVEFHQMEVLAFNIIDEVGDHTARGSNYKHGIPGLIRPLLKWK